jgi:hypothetical protein
MIRLLLAGVCLLFSGGCVFFPEISRQPQVHNPFPQLSRVAVAPFFNHSAEPSVDGNHFALAYANELQATPGFMVVPVLRVAQEMAANGITLANVEEVRRLAQILDVDAVVVGAVTDFTPYYPPRCGMQVEWFSANPGFHPIPPGYGLPWGTPEEEHIPPPLIFEARMALAQAQMKTQSPVYPVPELLPPPAQPPRVLPPAEETAAKDTGAKGSEIKLASHEQPLPPPGADGTTATGGAALPPDWPDPSGFTPPAPCPVRPPLLVSNEPVLRHIKTYNGHDADVTEALSAYVYFRDDARFGGWQSYLQRSDDYIRFCCHMHISEMLTARGGAGETRVVWRWPIVR